MKGLLTAIGYITALPHTIIGFLMCLYYRPHSWKFSHGCIESIVPENRLIGNPGAQTWGYLIFYRDERARNWNPLRVHERVHVKQAFCLSVIYPILWLLHFCVLFIIIRDWKAAYYKIYFEKKAYEIQRKFEVGKLENAWGVK